MKNLVFVSLKRTGLAALALAALSLMAVSCDTPTSAKVSGGGSSSDTTTTTTEPTTLWTISFTDTNLTSATARVTMIAQYGNFVVTASDSSCTNLAMTGTAWWDSGNTRAETTIADGASVTYTVKCNTASADFVMEIGDTVNTGYILDTSTQKTAWTYTAGGTVGTVSGTSAQALNWMLSGEVYKVIVTKNGVNYTVVYQDAGAQS